MESRSAPPRRPARLLSFRVIAVLLPFGLLVLLELLLRGVGYGQDYSLFVEAPDPDYWVMNPHASEKYFTTVENATRGNQEYFLKEKPTNTFRLFVLGASTGLGYPYLHNGSFHRWLHYRLLHDYPNVHFEVVNLSLTAVTTYTLLDFARQLTDYRPDAVLIYTGHNEYYGTLGVGSTSRLGNAPALVRTLVWLRDFRFMQLIDHAVASLRRSAAGAPDLRTNLMQRLAAEQSIPYGSDLYERGVAQYRSNLNDLLAHLDKHDVPVLLSNLVSNQKDLPPFVSDTTDPAGSAQAQYQRAQRAYRAANYEEAKAGFVQAKELDLLRFRAPAAMNETVHTLAERYDHVYPVDAQAMFARYSPHGIFGAETLLEHVHPNLYGYALLSEAFYRTLHTADVLPGPPADTLSLDELRAQMPITPVDSLRGVYETMMLKEGWPFHQPMPPVAARPKTVEESLAGQVAVQQLSWDEAMQRLLRHYVEADEYAAAARVAEARVLEYPYRAEGYRQAGQLYQRAGQDERAIGYLRRGFALQPSPEAAQALFVTLLTRDEPEAALPYLDYAARANTKLSELRTFAQRIVRLKRAYRQDTTRTELLPQIAATYLRFANTRAARPYVDQALATDPSNPTVQQLAAQLTRLETQRQ